jgi:hypothetical protein
VEWVSLIVGISILLLALATGVRRLPDWGNSPDVRTATVGHGLDTVFDEELVPTVLVDGPTDGTDRVIGILLDGGPWDSLESYSEAFQARYPIGSEVSLWKWPSETAWRLADQKVIPGKPRGLGPSFIWFGIGLAVTVWAVVRLIG